MDDIEAVVDQKKTFAFPALLTDQIKDIQAQHNLFLKTLNKWEADNTSAVKDEKSQVQCKPLVNDIAEKTTLLSKLWEEQQALVQLVKLDCGRGEGEYYQWLFQMKGTDSKVLPNSWTARKQELLDKKSRLDKCVPKWQRQMEEKISGGDKCKDVEGAVKEFQDAMGNLKAAKAEQFAQYELWLQEWEKKSELDKMCKAKSKFYRFAQKSSDEERDEENQRMLWEHHFQLSHSHEDLLHNSTFKQLESQLMSMQQDDQALEVQRFKASDKPVKPENQCQDCIKTPEKQSFFELNNQWKTLLTMQTELGELFFDLINQNTEAGIMQGFCEGKKKDLEALNNSLTFVHKLKEQTFNDWSKCLKERTKKNPDDIKATIHETEKQVMELTKDIIEIEKVISLDECENWFVFISGSIVEKYQGDCVKNKDLIERYWHMQVIKVNQATEKYKGPDGPLFVSVTSELNRLKELEWNKPCTTHFSVKIAKDTWEGDPEKPRKPCITMDEDNTDVNECQFELIKPPTEETKIARLAEEKKVLVWVNGKMQFCDAPKGVQDEKQEEAKANEGEQDPEKQKRPIINLINPQTCLPAGVTSQDPQVCRVGAEIQSANYAQFREMPAIACDQDQKEKFSPCSKVHYAVASSATQKAIVQQREKDSFQVCSMLDPNSPIEQKFDFTDKSLCDRCFMFEMFQPEDKLVEDMTSSQWPKLKGEADQFISEQIQDATHLNEDDCYFQVDKEALSQMATVQGEYSTDTSIPQPQSNQTTKLQLKAGTKCVWDKSGEDKTAWKITEIYIDPKMFDFAGHNRATIADRFKIKQDQESLIDTDKKHKLVTLSDYFCLEMKLMNSHANVLQSMWNWVYNLEWLGGPERNVEMEAEWADTSRIGQEALHKLELKQRWPKIWQEMQVRWSLQLHCFKQTQATLVFMEMPQHQDQTDLFYLANININNDNEVKLQKPREIEATKKVWGLADDNQFPMKDTATWYHEFDPENKFVSTEMNFSTQTNSQGQRQVWFQFFAVIRNTQNWQVQEHKDNAVHKWGCSIFDQQQRWDIGRSQQYYNWFGREWGSLCMQNDRGIKMLTRLQTQEKENKLLNQFQICLHQWKHDWHIVKGPAGDEFKADIQCWNMREFTEALQAATPLQDSATGATPKARFLEQKGKSLEQNKLDLKQRLKVLKAGKGGDDKKEDEEIWKKTWLNLKNSGFVQTMSVPQYCVNLKTFEGRDGQHMYANCK